MVTPSDVLPEYRSLDPCVSDCLMPLQIPGSWTGAPEPLPHCGYPIVPPPISSDIPENPIAMP